MARRNTKKQRTYKFYAGVLILFAVFLSFVYLNDSQVLPTTPIGITGMSSQVGDFTAGVQTSISCTWSNAALTVSYGTSLDPGSSDINATGNYNTTGSGTDYNVTNDILSNDEVNITVKGESFTSGANTIKVGNTTWASNSTSDAGANMLPGSSIELTTTYNTANETATNLAIGSIAYYRFWLDIPSNQVAGTYSGNYTMLCQAAP